MEQERGLKLSLETLPGGEGIMRASLKGQLTWPHIKQFQFEINRVLASGCKHLEIDLGDLSYLDSSGLATFIPINERFKQSEGTMKIINPRKFIRHIFISAHLDTVLDIGPEKS